MYIVSYSQDEIIMVRDYLIMQVSLNAKKSGAVWSGWYCFWVTMIKYALGVRLPIPIYDWDIFQDFVYCSVSSLITISEIDCQTLETIFSKSGYFKTWHIVKCYRSYLS